MDGRIKSGHDVSGVAVEEQGRNGKGRARAARPSSDLDKPASFCPGPFGR